MMVENNGCTSPLKLETMRTHFPTNLALPAHSVRKESLLSMASAPWTPVVTCNGKLRTEVNQ